MNRGLAAFVLTLLAARCWSQEKGAAARWIEVSADRGGFQIAGTTERFVPWGFNYDHDRDGRLIEDYWHDEWASVAGDFREMRALGANVVRVHLQFGRFMKTASQADERNIAQLKKLVRLAEETGLRLDITGLGCYHKRDVPPWYDDMTEAERWAAQAEFWRAVARACANSPAVFCYDLMNEPVSPGGKSQSKADWLGPAFGGKHFVQRISLDQAGRERWQIAKSWIDKLAAAIREHDPRSLITVGLVDWSLERPGLTSGFVPAKVAGQLDFIAVHLYHKSGKLKEDLETLAGFAAAGKPVVIEEMFPLGCTADELRTFIVAGKKAGHAAGWIGFYWGQTLDELSLPVAEKSGDKQARDRQVFANALMRSWLELFKGGRPE